MLDKSHFKSRGSVRGWGIELTRGQNTAATNKAEVVQNGAISSAKMLGYKTGYLVDCTIQIIWNQSVWLPGGQPTPYLSGLSWTTSNYLELNKIMNLRQSLVRNGSRKCGDSRPKCEVRACTPPQRDPWR
jgi:hypothetical protein